MGKKKKQKLQNFLNEFKLIINNHKNEVPIFDLNNKYKKKQINTSTWFNITKQKDTHHSKCNIVTTDKLDKPKFKCLKVKMILNKIHKKIFKNWFKSSTYTYNKTLEYIRNNFNFTKKEITKDILVKQMNNPTFFDKFYIRTEMNNERTKIIKAFSFNIRYVYNKCI